LKQVCEIRELRRPRRRRLFWALGAPAKIDRRVAVAADTMTSAQSSMLNTCLEETGY